ncbi:MAG: anthranilate synthase component I [Candidatus Omnitrophica bacterium]|nr:anthranilate synthase component I [Candidatus Omnitrophota bacterium]
MYTPSLKEFLKLSERYNVIPVYKEISADLDTPVSSFLKLKKDAYAFLLESVAGGENVARYSFLGSSPEVVFQSKGRNISITYDGASGLCPVKCPKGKKFILRYPTLTDPLEELKKFMNHIRAAGVEGLPRFFGGFVGNMGYDTVRFFEDIPDNNPDSLQIPDAVFILTDTVLAFDHVNNIIKIISNVILPPASGKISRAAKKNVYTRAMIKIEAIHRDLAGQAVPKAKKKNGVHAGSVRSNFRKAGFCSIVKKAREYIRKGDIIQVVLSQRFSVKTKKDPFDIYRDLRRLNPSPYMFFLKLDSVTLVGSSPEILVQCEQGIARTRPIAGTRVRGKTGARDKALEQELMRDTKERAEHLMLVDLGRNDLGRISEPGKVTVNEFMGVERYSHVMHLVSDVTARLSKKFDIYDVLRACFPAGTVSGSPKIRAMEIIDELENVKRGPYAGAVGYFSFSHNMDTCIAIRTVVIKGDTAYVQAGAGIVLDSVPEKEYNESVNKARALIEAIRAVHN